MPLDGDTLNDHAETLRSMAAEVSNKEALAQIVGYLDNLSATMRGKARLSNKDEALQDIQQALLTLRFKSSHDMVHVAKSAVEMLYPGTTPSTQNLKADSTTLLNQFRVDLAYLLMTRNENFTTCMLKFAWADASPQGPFDWLLWKHRYVRAQHLLQVVEALTALILSPGGSLGGEVGADAEVPIDTFETRRRANADLIRFILEHLCVLPL